jgi:PTH1 family peptidyl-tRNA hydrolase
MSLDLDSACQNRISRYAFIGLGNPGVKYESTRHNIGFRVIDAWLRRLDIQLTPISDSFHGVLTTIDQNDIVLMKPMTYMNLSGLAVFDAIKYYALNLDALVVIYDDVHLPIGSLRLRGKGSHGGHNGLASVIDTLATVSITRQRIGVGEPSEDGNLVDYVLDSFTNPEERLLPVIVDRACDQLETFVTDGWMEAASRYNGAIDLKNSN